MSILKIACMDETAATFDEFWFGPDFAGKSVSVWLRSISRKISGSAAR